MDTHSEVEATSRPDHTPGLSATRRRWAVVLTLVSVSALIVAGATVLIVARNSGAGRRAIRPITATRVAANRPAPCRPSSARPDGTDPTRVGGWPYHLIENGTFGAVVSGPSGTAFAIEACGADESDLRVVRISLGGIEPLQASAYVHAALLTSSLVSSGGSLYLGAARLDLAGSTSSPPYELTIYRLDATTLRFTASRALGRGYGLTLAAGGSRLAAVTGSSLLTIDRSTLGSRALAGFGQSVAQHVVADPARGELAVSLATPAAVPPAAGARIELLDERTGHAVSTVSLPAGSDPESLALADGRLWAAVGNGLTTTVRVYRVPSPTQVASRDAGKPESAQTALESLALDATGGVVWTQGMSLLECSSATTGKVLATTNQYGPAPVFVTQIFENRAGLYAVSTAGIGRLSSPAACRS